MACPSYYDVEDRAGEMKSEQKWIRSVCEIPQIVPFICGDNVEEALSGMVTLCAVIERQKMMASPVTMEETFRIVEKLTGFFDSEIPQVRREARRALPMVFSIDPRIMVDLVTMDAGRIDIGLRAIEKVLRVDSTFKLRFQQMGGIVFITGIQVELLPSEMRAIVLGIIAICIREDFPEPIYDDVSLSLLSPVMTIVNNPGSESAECLTEAARACYYFSCVSHRVCAFMSSGGHRSLSAAFAAMPVKARTYVVSVFGNCFFSDACVELAINEIPLEMLAVHLNCDDTDARHDTSIAIKNVASCSKDITSIVCASGLLKAIIDHLVGVEDNFVTKQQLAVAVSRLIGHASESNACVYLIPELFEALDDIRGADDGEIEEALTLVTAVVMPMENIDDVIQQYMELWKDM